MALFNILGEKYYINLDKYVSFFCDLRAAEKEKNSIITMTYGQDSDGYTDDTDMNLLAKEIVESKVNTNSQTQTLRYDTLKMFMDLLFGTYYKDDGNLVDPSFDELTFQQKFAFNTLVKFGILVKDENNE